MHASRQQHAHAKPVIGLLGAPGSGKSFVARLFEREGCAIIDADRLAHEAINEPGVREQLRSWWGEDVVDAEGQVDRRAVGRRVFNAPDELARLESVVHPRVHERRRALRERHQADPAVKAIVEDCPLLLETGLDAECDVLVLVDAPLAVRQQRVAAARGWSADELARREKNQALLDIKRQRAHHVVDNSAGEQPAREQVRLVLSLIFQHKEPA